MDTNEVMQMLDCIERIAQCPVCLDVVKPPVSQCGNGHIYCGQCQELLTQCPVCQEPFIATINRVVEELLNVLPKKCPYADKGCKTVTLLDGHTQYCEYRSITCIIGRNNSCTWSGTVKEWKIHLESLHPEYKAGYNFNKSIEVSFKNFNDGWQTLGYYQKISDEIFLIYAWKVGGKMCLTFRHIECKKPPKEYLLIITFQNENQVFHRSLINSKPLNVNESIENNPTAFLLRDLNSLTKDYKLTATFLAVQADLSEDL